MKEVLTIMAAVCLTFSLCACGGSKKSSSYSSSYSGSITNSYSSTQKSNSCGHPSCAEMGPFWCMGKNDTCTNKTYCCYDYYCDECD